MLIPKGLPKTKVVGTLAVVVLIVAVIGYLVYTNFLQTGGSRQLSTGTAELEATAGLLPEVKGFDPEFFSQPAVRVLKNFGQLPLTVPTTGRSNPFSPLVLPTAPRRPGR